MIYKFLEDYTVNENATLLKSKMCGQGASSSISLTFLFQPVRLAGG
jgi:hypothetical protein